MPLAGGADGVVTISLDDRLREVEANLIRWALEASHGNKSKAAALLQVKRSTLGDRIRHCGLERSTSQSREPPAAAAAAGISRPAVGGLHSMTAAPRDSPRVRIPAGRHDPQEPRHL